MAERKQEKTENAERFALSFLESKSPKWQSTKEISSQVKIRAGAEKAEAAHASYALQQLERQGLVERRDDSGQWWRMRVDVARNVQIAEVRAELKKALFYLGEMTAAASNAFSIIKQLDGRLRGQLKRQENLFKDMERGQSGTKKGA